MKQVTQQQVIQALDRLSFFSNKQSPLQAITPFFHTAETLQKFGKNQSYQLKLKQPYFQRFYQMFGKFAIRDFSLLKKHHQHVLEQIVGIIQSQSFVNCIRPDINQLRHLRHNLKRTKISVIKLQAEQYDFITGQITKSQSFGNTSQSGKQVDNSLDQINQFTEQKQKNQNIEQSLSSAQSQQLQKLYNSVKKSYSQHNIDQARMKMQQYLQKLNKKDIISKQKTQFFKNLQQEYQTMISFYSQFDKDQWTFDKKQKGITLQYKIDDKQNMIAIRIQGEGDIPIEPFLSIISEIDLMGQYVPFCYGCQQVKKVSRNQRIGTSKIYIPLLNDRQTFFYAAGYDRIKTNKSLFFYSKTINEDLHYQKKYNFQVPKEGKFVRLQYKFFIIQYIPITKTRAKIRLATKIDMKMNYLPSFILFKSARIFAFDYFKNIIDRIKNFKGSAWQKKIEQNPEMYKFFHKKLDQFII